MSPTPASDRKFGLLVGTAFVCLGAYKIFRTSHPIWSWGLIIVGLALDITALAAPELLKPLNRLWTRLGAAMGKVVSPIVLGLIFLILLTPIALLSRLLGRDELRLKRWAVRSYWVERQPADAQHFKQQF